MTSAHPAYTPTVLTDADLDFITVAREREIADMVGRLRQAATTGARPHTLVIGPRGAGKTHLLTVATRRAFADPEIAGRLVLARIPEDAHMVTSYEDLLREIVRELGGDIRQAAEARRLRHTGALERMVEDLVGDRVLVLSIENLDRVFDDLTRNGAAALRGFVETERNILLLASTPALSDAIRNRDEPFFGSFNQERLTDLTLAEGTELVRRRAVRGGDVELAEFVTSRTGQARLAAIAHLAGGSPRLWHILADAVDVTGLDAVIPTVEAMLEQLAPYYQARLSELAPTERHLVIELARGDGMRTVKDLADSVGIGERQAATAMKELTRGAWVTSTKLPGTDQRLTWYDLREGLLRHHVQYRENDGEPLRVLIEFLRLWFSQEERLDLLAGASKDGRGTDLLARSFLRDAPLRADFGWATGDVRDLLAEARRDMAFVREALGRVEPTQRQALLARALLELGADSDNRRWLLDIGGEPGMVMDLAHALDGDASARARLPAEIRAILDRRTLVVDR